MARKNKSKKGKGGGNNNHNNHNSHNQQAKQAKPAAACAKPAEEKLTEVKVPDAPTATAPESSDVLVGLYAVAAAATAVAASDATSEDSFTQCTSPGEGEIKAGDAMRKEDEKEEEEEEQETEVYDEPHAKGKVGNQETVNENDDEGAGNTDGDAEDQIPVEPKDITTRPDVKALESQGILKDAHVAPSLQSTAQKLEHQLKKDQVAQLLESRPDAEALLHKNILEHDAEKIASGIQGVQKQLAMELKKDQMSQMLDRRPSVQDLENAGIIDAKQQVAPSLHARRKSLEMNLKRDSLSRKLSDTRQMLEVAESMAPSTSDVASSTFNALVWRGDGGVAATAYAAAMSTSEEDNSSQEQAGDETSGDLSDDEEEDENDDDYDSSGSGYTPQHVRHVLGSALAGAELGVNASVAVSDFFTREKYAVALKAAARLEQTGVLNESAKGRLKDLILSDDERVMAVVNVFAQDQDVNEMLDSFVRIIAA